jgi:hypothetical protein
MNTRCFHRMQKREFKGRTFGGAEKRRQEALERQKATLPPPSDI